MKKFTLLILLFTVFGYSQDCKYKINEIDEFTKNKVLETKGGLLTISGMGFGFSSGYNLKKINDNRYFKLSISSPSIFTLRQGSEIMFKTDKENTINLKLPETVIAEYISGSIIGSSRTPSRWSGTILIPISDENFERLKSELVIKLRIYTGDGYIDDEVSKKRAKSLQYETKCIL